VWCLLHCTRPGHRPQGVGERVKDISVISGRRRTGGPMVVASASCGASSLYLLLLMLCLHCVCSAAAVYCIAEAEAEAEAHQPWGIDRSIVSAPVPSYCPPSIPCSFKSDYTAFQASNGWMYQQGGHFDGVSACFALAFSDGGMACVSPRLLAIYPGLNLT